MEAIIKTGGKQYLVKLGQHLKIEKIDKKVGETFSFDNVLLTFDKDSGKTEIGAPRLKVPVEAEVLAEARAKKVIIFKYKPKKRYKVKKGHRQSYNLVEIVRIGDKKLAPKKVVEKPKPEVVAVKPEGPKVVKFREGKEKIAKKPVKAPEQDKKIIVEEQKSAKKVFFE